MIDPEKLYNRSMTAAEEWADKDHAAGVLEDALGTLESDIAAELKARGEPVSVIPKMIKCDQRWKDAAQSWRQAKRDALIAKLKYEQANRYQDNLRTKESTERQLAR